MIRQTEPRLFALSETGLWRITPDDDRTTTAVINRAYRDGQNLITLDAGDPQLIAGSKAKAELVLATFFKAVGWEIAIRWAD